VGVVDARRIGAGDASRCSGAGNRPSNRDVAIKVLDGRVDDEATERRFRRKSRLLGSLGEHTNIVTIL
jgi:serine/threonine protein kinase